MCKEAWVGGQGLVSLKHVTRINTINLGIILTVQNFRAEMKV